MRDDLYLPLNQKICKVLKQKRKESGITQLEMAEKSGRSQAYISKFENGQIRLDVGDFIKMSQAVDIDPRVLLDDLMALPTAPEPIRGSIKHVLEDEIKLQAKLAEEILAAFEDIDNTRVSEKLRLTLSAMRKKLKESIE